MMYLIASDFHGRIGAYKDLVRAVSECKPDKVILLGDLCGASPSGINAELDKIYCQIFAVRGNCDPLTDFSALDFGDAGLCYSEKSGGRNLFFTHGHIYGRTAFPPFSEKGDILFYGHYHFPEISVIKGITCVCVGSMGQPRGGSVPTFCLFDEKTIKICARDTLEVLNEYAPRANV